jgi:hypothetical protein
MINVSFAAVGPDNIVTISQTSSTGKTIIVNRGSSSYFAENKLGVLLEVIQKKNRKIFRPVARIKSVKVFSESSIWIAYKTFVDSSLVKDKKLILLEEVNLLKGRTGLKFSRSKIVSSKQDMPIAVKENFVEGTEKLAVKENEYRVLRDLHGKEKHDDNDINLVDLDVWEAKKGTQKKTPTSLYKSKHAKAFERKHEIQTFEKMVVAFIRKYNDPKFTIARKYFNDRDDNNLISDLNSSSVYTTYLENEEKNLEKEDRIYDDLNSKGEAWSDGYSDEELSELVYNVGVIKERERRFMVSAYHFQHQIYGHFGLNLVNNENLKDKNNTAQSKYDLELAWEYYAFKDLQRLKNFAFEFGLRRSVDAYSIGGGFNATSTELSFTGGLNYYPFRSPNTLEANIVYASAYVRSGVSVLSVKDTNEQGSYSVLAIPGIRFGVKYNFSNAFGVRFFGSFENLTASRIEKSDPDGVLPEEASYTDGRLSVGLSRLF